MKFAMVLLASVTAFSTAYATDPIDHPAGTLVGAYRLVDDPSVSQPEAADTLLITFENEKLVIRTKIDDAYTALRGGKIESLLIEFPLSQLNSKPFVKEDKGSHTANGARVHFNTKKTTKLISEIPVMGGYRLARLEHDVRDYIKLPVIGKEMPDSVVLSNLKGPYLRTKIQGIIGAYLRVPSEN